MRRFPVRCKVVYQEPEGDRVARSYPTAVTADATGAACFFDRGTGSLKRLHPDGTIEPLTGPAIAQPSHHQERPVLGGDGGLYFCDRERHRICRIDPATGVFGVLTGGSPGQVDGPLSEARFDQPVDLCTGPRGELFVADKGNNAVRCIEPEGTVRTVAIATPLVVPAVPVPDLEPGVTRMAMQRKRNTLEQPTLIRCLPDGRLVVVDSNNTRIQLVMADGTVENLAGAGLDSVFNQPEFADGSGASAEFRSVTDVTIAPDGSLLVVDWGNHRLRRVTLDGRVETFAGGNEGELRDGDRLSARFTSPYWVEWSAESDALMVWDRRFGEPEQDALRQINKAGRVTTRKFERTGTAPFPGTARLPRFAWMKVGDPLTLLADPMNPGGIWCFDEHGAHDLAYADTILNAPAPNDVTVMQSRPDGSIVMLASGSRKVLRSSHSGHYQVIFEKAQPSTSEPHDQPGEFIGMAVRSTGEILLSDAEQHCLWHLRPDGAISRWFAPEDARLQGEPPLQEPGPMILDAEGTLIVLDAVGVRRIRSDLTMTTQVLPKFKYSLHRGPNLALDPAGNLVGILETWGICFIVTAQGEVGMLSLAGGPEPLRLKAGANMGSTVGETMWVAESDAGRMRQLKLAADEPIIEFDHLTPDPIDGHVVVQTVAGCGLIGREDGTSQEARFHHPSHAVEAPDGTLYVIDCGNDRIRAVSPDGTVSTLAGGPPGCKDGPAADASFDEPMFAAFDSHGDLLVTDRQNGLVRKVTPGGEVSTFAGSMRPSMYLARDFVTIQDAEGERTYSREEWERIEESWHRGNGPARLARFHLPKGLAVDHEGNVIVADSGDRRLRRISRSEEVSGLAGTWGGTDYWYNLKDGSGPEAVFGDPVGVAVDVDGSYVVVDAHNAALRAVTREGDVRTVAGGLNGDWGLPTVMEGATGVAVGADGTYFVADTRRHRVLRFGRDGSWSVLAGGEPGFRDGDGTTAQFFRPYGLSIGRDGNLLVADSRNHTIRRIVLHADPSLLKACRHWGSDREQWRHDEHQPIDEPGEAIASLPSLRTFEQMPGRRIRSVEQLFDEEAIQIHFDDASIRIEGVGEDPCPTWFESSGEEGMRLDREAAPLEDRRISHVAMVFGERLWASGISELQLGFEGGNRLWLKPDLDHPNWDDVVGLTTPWAKREPKPFGDWCSVGATHVKEASWRDEGRTLRLELEGFFFEGVQIVDVSATCDVLRLSRVAEEASDASPLEPADPEHLRERTISRVEVVVSQAEGKCGAWAELVLGDERLRLESVDPQTLRATYAELVARRVGTLS